MAKKAEKIDKVEEAEQVKKLDKVTYYSAVGRRREASAQVRLYAVVNEGLKLGDQTYEVGAFIVNNRPVDNYFPGEIFKKRYMEPLRTTNTLDRFVISVKVFGGGPNGQVEAVIHGLSRALLEVDSETYRPILKKRGFLMRDPRTRQRRKAGFAQKSRKKKQSPKR